MLTRFFRRIYYYYFYVVLAVVFVGLWPVAYILFSRKDWHRAGQKFRKRWAQLALFLSFISVEIRYEEKPLQDKVYIYVSNHFSFLDIAVCLSSVPSYFGFLGKVELGSNPLLRIFYRTIDIDVDRGSSEKSAVSYKRSLQALAEGKSLVIFPEGGILGKPALHEFKTGPFDMAIRTKIDIIPFTMPDNFKRLPDGIKEGAPGKVRVIFHKATEASTLAKADTENLKNSVYNIIQKQLVLANINN